LRALWLQGFQIDLIAYGKGVWSVLYSKPEDGYEDAVARADRAAGALVSWRRRAQEAPDASRGAVEGAPRRAPARLWRRRLGVPHLRARRRRRRAQLVAKATPQLIVKSSSFPEEQISANWDRGMYIRSMVHGTASASSCSSRTGDVPQSLYMDKAFPEAEIEDLWQDCYVCSNLVFADGKWVLVSNELSRNNHQGWVSDTIFPTDDLDELLCAGGLQPKVGEFFCVFVVFLFSVLTFQMMMHHTCSLAVGN
jgi:hypothetical protein